MTRKTPMATTDPLGFMGEIEEQHRSLVELRGDVAQLAMNLGGLTIDIGVKIAPEIDRLHSSRQEHGEQLNEVAEELGRLNRNLETLQAGFKRVIKKIGEHELRLDAMDKERVKEKAASAPAAPKNPIPAKTSDDETGDFEGIFKDLSDTFKDVTSIFRFKSKKTIKG